MLSEQSFTAYMPLMMAPSTFGLELREIHYSTGSDRAIARILFQPRQKGKLGTRGGLAAKRPEESTPWSGGQWGKAPLKLKAFQ